MILLYCLTLSPEHLANGLEHRHAGKGASVQRLKSKQAQDKKTVLDAPPLCILFLFTTLEAFPQPLQPHATIKYRSKQPWQAGTGLRFLFLYLV